MINTPGNNKLNPETVNSIKNFIIKYVEANKNNRLNYFNVLNQEVHKNAIVFAGDSMIERFPLSELFPSVPFIYNRGISGIEAIDLLEHLEEMILQLSPAKLFLLIGSNDIGTGVITEEVGKRIQKICEKVNKKLSETKIYLLSVCPINSDLQDKNNFLERSRSNTVIDQLNELLRKKAAEVSNYTYLDIYTILSDREGNLKAEYTSDGLHLSIEGYKKVADFLRIYI